MWNGQCFENVFNREILKSIVSGGSGYDTLIPVPLVYAYIFYYYYLGYLKTSINTYDYLSDKLK